MKIADASTRSNAARSNAARQRPSFLLTVLGEANAVAACTLLVLRSGDFSFDPLPDDYYEFAIHDHAKRDRVLASLLSHVTLAAMEVVPAWELHVKADVLWKLVAPDAQQAVRLMQEYIEDCGGEIEPMEDPFLPVEQWQPRRVPVAWVPAAPGRIN